MQCDKKSLLAAVDASKKRNLMVVGGHAAIIYTIIYDIEMVLKEKKIYFFKFYFLEKDLVRLSFYFPLFITAWFSIKTHSGDMMSFHGLVSHQNSLVLKP